METTGKRIEKIEDVRAFVSAGRAIFTLVSKKTGTRFTYKVRQKENCPVAFVSLLRGPSNEADYSYFGFVRDGKFIHGGSKARAGKDSLAVVAFSWFHGRLSVGDLSEQIEVWHEGRCGRCGRRLTVPESIERGIGPECASRAA